MRRIPPSIVGPGHPDFGLLSLIADEIEALIGIRLEAAFTALILDAVEFVLDPIRTGRTTIVQLDNVEKTFIGLKVEHFVRDLLNAPKGVRDLTLAGHDVDVKNTVSRSWAWMIPPESFRNEEPVLLIAADEDARKAWMGLLVCRPQYLGSPNRDDKRGVLSSAYQHILWLAEGLDWPPNRWHGLDMRRFRELRDVPGGAARAAMFFEENLGRVTHRSIAVALLFDQQDPLKRLRGNHGARDILAPKGIALLSGTRDRSVAAQLGFLIAGDEFVAVAPTAADDVDRLVQAGKISSILRP